MDYTEVLELKKNIEESNYCYLGMGADEVAMELIKYIERLRGDNDERAM